MAHDWYAYTTFYPAALGFAADFFRGLDFQTDADFALCVGLDGVTPSDLEAAAGRPVKAEFVASLPGETPAGLRSRALEGVAGRCRGVMLLDGDDIAMPDRVAAAKAGLEEADVVACAMELVDGRGRSMGQVFPPAGPDMADRNMADQDAADHLRCNVFGFSNTAYRAETLASCLPAPEGCVCMDWYVSTLALARGARLALDPAPRMAYRQHGANIAQVLPPFDRRGLLAQAGLVLGHYGMLEDHGAPRRAGMGEALDEACSRAERFRDVMDADAGTARRYVDALNAMGGCLRWWEGVAHPSLEDIWTS